MEFVHCSILPLNVTLADSGGRSLAGLLLLLFVLLGAALPLDLGREGRLAVERRLELREFRRRRHRFCSLTTFVHGRGGHGVVWGCGMAGGTWDERGTRVTFTRYA